MNGILPINKPSEFTSFDVVAKLRGILNIKKIGHGGTLDPMATGVLPIFLGSATKIIDLISDQNKKYIAGFKLGISTDSQDITGRVLQTTTSNISQKELLLCLQKFIGQINQIPPMFSAVKINGQKLYSLAYKGKEIERNARAVNIFYIKLLEFNQLSQQGIIEVYSSKGTYIRTLIHDIGISLGVGATLTSLHRIQALGVNINSCYTIDQVKDLKHLGDINNILISADEMLKNYPEVFLSNDIIDKLLMGIKLPLLLPGDSLFRIYNDEKSFIGLAYNHNNQYIKFKTRI